MGINVLSLFDGMSCGQIALEKAGIEVNNYFASEIDKYCIKVTMANYPNTIQLGDVFEINTECLPKIDLLIGGSPCQNFSFAGKMKGMSTKESIEIYTLEHYLKLKDEGFTFEGQSYLFWEFVRLLKEFKPKYFLLENVKMSKKWEKILTQGLINALGVEVTPLLINSNLVSAQNRERLYWTNIPNLTQPKDRSIYLKDIILEGLPCKLIKQEKVLDKVNITKASTLLARDYKGFGNQGMTGVIMDNIISLEDNEKIPHTLQGLKKLKEAQDGIIATQLTSSKNFGNAVNCKGKAFTLRSSTPNGLIYKEAPYYFYRALVPLECERLQTVPEGYTEGVSNTQRYKMLGNGWTVDVIAHIFNGLLDENL